MSHALRTWKRRFISSESQTRGPRRYPSYGIQWRDAARRVGDLKRLGGPLLDRPWQVNVVHEDGCSRRGERFPFSHVARMIR